MVRAILLSIAFLLAALIASADLQVWVDADGTTHVTDDPEKIPPELRDRKVERVEELRVLWDDGVSGPPLVTPRGSSSSEEDRALRELRGALDDLRRGETARASATVPSGPSSRSGSRRPSIQAITSRSSSPSVFSGSRWVSSTVPGWERGISEARSASATERPASTSAISAPAATAVEGPRRLWFS